MLFPRIHTGHATFTASGVPVLDVTSQVLVFEAGDLGYPSKAHQAEARHNPSHDNPHYAGEQDVITSTVICFPHFIPYSSRQASFPGKPSPCLSHYSRALGYYAASALYPAC
jgi:hypothetical protein